MPSLGPFILPSLATGGLLIAGLGAVIRHIASRQTTSDPETIAKTDAVAKRGRWATFALTVTFVLLAVLGYGTNLASIWVDSIEKYQDSEELKQDKTKLNQQVDDLRQTVQARSDQLFAAQQESARSLHELDVANKKVIVAQEESERLLRELNEKSEQVITTQEAFLSYTTGGGSIFYLDFAGNREFPGFGVTGSNPVRDVHLAIVNCTKMRAVATRPMKEIRANAFVERDLNIVWPHSGLGIRDFPYPDSGVAMYEILVAQPNARALELAVIERLGGDTYRCAYRVFRFRESDGKLDELVRHTDADFPLDASGKIEWLDDPAKWPVIFDSVVKDGGTPPAKPATFLDGRPD